MRGNPNATAAGTSGGVSVALVGLLALFGVELDAVLATALTGLLTTVVLLVGRSGVKGLVRTIWSGSSEGSDTP